jgi:hypothetical protein
MEQQRQIRKLASTRNRHEDQEKSHQQPRQHSLDANVTPHVLRPNHARRLARHGCPVSSYLQPRPKRFQLIYT